MSQKIRILLHDGGVERVDEDYEREYDDEWYDQYAYDRDGWDRRWFNIYGVHKITKDYFDQQGLDEWLFDRHWINHCSDIFGDVVEKVIVRKKENIFWHPWDMVCEFNSIGIHKITHTPFNECWLNWKGIDMQGNCVMTKKYSNLCMLSDSLHKEIRQLTKEKQQLVVFRSSQVRKKTEEVIRECEGRKKEFELKIKELQQQRESLEKELHAPPSPFVLKKSEWKVKTGLLRDLELEIQKINGKISQEKIFLEEIRLSKWKTLNYDLRDIDIKIWDIQQQLNDWKNKLIKLQKDIDQEKAKRSILVRYFNN